MYVILVYDVEVERVAKVLRVARKYLSWVQNSVLEGELTRAQLERLKAEIRQVMDPEVDSVIIYVLRYRDMMVRDQLGREKGVEGNIL